MFQSDPTKFLVTSLKWVFKSATVITTLAKGIQDQKKAKGKISALHQECYEHNIQHRNIMVADQCEKYESQLSMLKQEIVPVKLSIEKVHSALLPLKEKVEMDNAIITGGKSTIRNRALATLIARATKNNIPVMILHMNNSGLSELLKKSKVGDKVQVVERGSLSYSPFIGMTATEVGRMVFQSIPEKYGVKFAARDIIRVACEIIVARKLIPNPASLAACPILDLVSKINTLIESGELSQSVGNELISAYMSSQAETRALTHFLDDLGFQLKGMSNDNGANGCDMDKSIKNGDVILLNVGSNNNDLAMNLVIQNIKQLFDQGHSFVIIADDIDFVKYKSLMELVLHNRSGFILSYDDLFSSVGGDEKAFSTITGAVEKVIIHATPSGFSCSQWSKYLGDYERREPKDNISTGIQDGFRRNSGEGATIEIKRESRVPPEILNQLQGAQACIYNAQFNGILFADIH